MSYFEPTACERNGALHRRLGTRRFRPFVAGGRFWQRLGLANPRHWNEAQLRSYVAQSKQLELAHLASLLVLLVAIGYLVSRGDWWGVLVLALINLLANFYPILVVRYNRHRIERRLRRTHPNPGSLTDESTRYR